ADVSRETVIETVNETKQSQCSASGGQVPISQPSTPYSEVLQQTVSTTVSNQQNASRSIAATPQPSTDGLQRTSTPKTPNQQHTDRPHTTPRLSQQHRQGSHPESRSRPSQQRRNLRKKILLMGDSVISPVNPRGLKKEVFKHSISGARIDHIFDQTNIFNMNQVSEVIIFVGGNDASNGTDIEYFEELYEQVILNLKQVNDTCQIYLCNMSPRSDTDITEVNQVIHRLCQDHNLTMVDINSAFYDKRGRLIERYYSDDLIHLSTSGVKRLLGEIDKEINIVENFDNCSFKSRYQKRGHVQKRSSQTNNQRSGRNSERSSSNLRRGRSVKYRENNSVNNGAACYKCGETNHQTSRCKHQEQLKCYYCGFYGHKSGRCLNQ
ncbi:MAG: GDSL-type esterase/lipase family protein, partial [Candidatus Thiodiazotropha sp.]